MCLRLDSFTGIKLMANVAPDATHSEGWRCVPVPAPDSNTESNLSAYNCTDVNPLARDEDVYLCLCLDSNTESDFLGIQLYRCKPSRGEDAYLCLCLDSNTGSGFLAYVPM